MQIIHSLNYLDFSFDKESQVFILTWHQSSSDISAEEYKNSAMVFKEIYSDYKGKHVLNDLRNFTYTITPEEQDWIAENLMADLVKNYQLTKMAYLLPQEDLFAMVSTEQVSEEIIEATNDDFQSQFFDNPEEGLIWLLS